MPRDASIYSRSGRPFYFISYWCPERMKRVHESTRWRLDDPNGYKHALRYADAKSQAASNFRGVAKKEVWSVWVEPWLRDRYRKQAKTLTSHLNSWAMIRVFLDQNHLPHPGMVTYNHVLKYVAWRQTTKRHNGKFISKNTALHEVICWGLVMQEAMRRGFATVNPCHRLGLTKDPAPEKPEMTDAQIRICFDRLADLERGRPITERWMSTSLRIALHHATRLSECQIPMSSIDLQAGTVKIVAKGRNGVAKVFTNRIHPALLPLFKDLRDAGAAYTCVLPKMASVRWHEFFKGPDAPPELKNLCFHCTRVTVVTRLARAGVPEQQAMRYVGHASRIVHQIYQRLKAEDMSVAQSALTYG